jgi:hypothetical protein
VRDRRSSGSASPDAGFPFTHTASYHRRVVFTRSRVASRVLSGSKALTSTWRGGRAVECAGLENRYGRFRPSGVRIPPSPSITRGHPSVGCTRRRRRRGGGRPSAAVGSVSRPLQDLAAGLSQRRGRRIDVGHEQRRVAVHGVQNLGGRTEQQERAHPGQGHQAEVRPSDVIDTGQTVVHRERGAKNPAPSLRHHCAAPHRGETRTTRRRTRHGRERLSGQTWVMGLDPGPRTPDPRPGTPDPDPGPGTAPSGTRRTVARPQPDRGARFVRADLRVPGRSDPTGLCDRGRGRRSGHL